MLGRPVRAQLEPSGYQVVNVLVDGGFRPDAIVARAGRPLRLVFRRDDADECSERVVFSAPRLDRRLAAQGMTTVELPPLTPGQVRFTCAMGRYRGRIEIVDERRQSLIGRLRDRAARLDAPLGTALVLWICSLPLIALLGALILGMTSALALAGVALVAWVAGCLWAYSRSTTAA